jgi:hypothetical protein
MNAPAGIPQKEVFEMATEHGQGGILKKDWLDVIVTYAAAKHPYEDKHAERTTTLQELKATVMDRFKVHEANTGNEQVLFWLYLGSEKLQDLSRTVGDLANGSVKLELMLVQQIIYGA